jgi:hypothetical protein
VQVKHEAEECASVSSTNTFYSPALSWEYYRCTGLQLPPFNWRARLHGVHFVFTSGWSVRGRQTIRTRNSTGLRYNFGLWGSCSHQWSSRAYSLVSFVLLIFVAFSRSCHLIKFYSLMFLLYVSSQFLIVFGGSRNQERHMHCALHIIGSMTDSWNMKRHYVEGSFPHKIVVVISSHPIILQFVFFDFSL